MGHNDRFHAGAMLVCASAYIFAMYALFAFTGSASADVSSAPLSDPRMEMARKANLDRIPPVCEYHDGDKVPKCPDAAGAKVAIWGDSMALAWSAGLPGSVVYSFPGCVPILGRPGAKGCQEWNDDVLKHLHGETLFIAARWVAYREPEVDLTPTLEAARSFKRVVVIGPTPFMQSTAARCIRGDVENCGRPRAQFDLDNKPILARLRAQAKPFPNVEVWDMAGDFCSATECPVILDGVVLYHDQNHPSMTQAKRVLAQRQVTIKR